MRPLFPTLRSFFGARRPSFADRRALLRLLATAVEERIEAAPLVAAWAAESVGWQRKKLRRLARLLYEGVPLPDAVERVPVLLSDDEILMIRFAAESGSLASTLRNYVQQPSPSTTRSSANATAVLVYFCIAPPLCLFLATEVAPELQNLYREGLGLAQPDFFTAILLGYIWTAWIGGAMWLALALLGLFFWFRFFDWPGRLYRRNISGRFSAAVRGRRIASVLRRLGENSTTGRPLAGAISTLARYHYDPWLRNKLLFVRNELALGAEPWPALESAGLLSAAERRALAASDRTATRGWTLGALADSRGRRAGEGLANARSAVWLALLLLFAALVAVVAIGMFQFLESLITGLL